MGSEEYRRIRRRPERVTVDGDSAGAASIGNLVASPRTKGLFQRAIAESGAWLGLSVSPHEHSRRSRTGRNERQTQALSADLRALSAADILKIRGGGPIIDGWFLPEDARQGLRRGKAKRYPGASRLEQRRRHVLRCSPPRRQIRRTVHRRYGDRADEYLNLYPGETDEEANASQLAAFRDELGWVMRNWASLQSKTGKSKAYLYYFTHEPPAANRPRRAEVAVRRDARLGSRLCVREPAPAAPLDRSRSPGCRHALLLLGQLRDKRKPQRQRTYRVARFEKTSRPPDGSWRQSGTRARTR